MVGGELPIHSIGFTDVSGARSKNLTISNAEHLTTEYGLLAGFVMANPGEQIVFENITVSGSVEIESTDGSNNVGG